MLSLLTEHFIRFRSGLFVASAGLFVLKTDVFVLKTDLFVLNTDLFNNAAPKKHGSFDARRYP